MPENSKPSLLDVLALALQAEAPPTKEELQEIPSPLDVLDADAVTGEQQAGNLVGLFGINLPPTNE